MKPIPDRPARTSRLLEFVLWIAGCCALSYCIFLLADALITQARLARTFERSRAVKVNSVPLAPTIGSATSKLGKPDSAPAGTALLGRLKIPRIGVSAMVLDGAGP